MKYFEFGQGNPELMVMLPGGGVCYRGAIPIAEKMAKVYHVVLVAYDGVTEIMPALCNVDFAAMELLHANLVRTTN